MTFALRDVHGRKYPIYTKLQIGSDAGNQIVLLDPLVAPLHAVLLDQQGNLVLQDCAGRGTTLVNQVPVQGAVSLRLGDRVTVGGTTFVVEDLNAVSAAPPAGPAKPERKRFGCVKWLLVGILMFSVTCLLIGAVSFYFYSTDVEVRGTLMDYLGGTSQKSETGEPTGPGPQILNLKDSYLNMDYTANFSQRQTQIVEGKGPDGNAIRTNLVFDAMQQGNPYAFYNRVEKKINDQLIAQVESTILNDQIYSGTKSCTSSADPDKDKHQSKPFLAGVLGNELTGHVRLAEAGVTINGVVTDRYELRADNFNAASSIEEFTSGNVYRAQEGGYLVRLEYTVVVQPQSWAINSGDEYSATDPAKVSLSFDRTYVPNEQPVDIKVPQVCAGSQP
jgi:hypothetical protein